MIEEPEILNIATVLGIERIVTPPTEMIEDGFAVSFPSAASFTQA
jgi:hypothetical protein